MGPSSRWRSFASIDLWIQVGDLDAWNVPKSRKVGLRTWRPFRSEPQQTESGLAHALHGFEHVLHGVKRGLAPGG